MIDTDQADRDLADGIARAFVPLFDAIPQGVVIGIDETGPGFVRLCLRDDDGTESTWLISFRLGEPFEATRLG